MDEERKRIADTSGFVPHWQKWGPYVSERSWGTVREDYSHDGNAWAYFPHEQARFRAYRWGEDGIAGWCDRYQMLVFAPAFWNGKDPILKERLFGLNSWEGNHGEDVKEVYYHLDGVPSHAYMKYLYRYPHGMFPYDQLVQGNQHRSLHDAEFELIDTGIFHENRYFDIEIEYAKASPEDTCIRITAHNRGNEAAPLHILPHLWFRNQWSWNHPVLPSPEITKQGHVLIADEREMRPPQNLPFEYRLGKRYLTATPGGKALFTNNATRHSSEDRYTKEAFHEAIIRGCETADRGSKACLQYSFEVPPCGSVTVRLRLSDKERSIDEVDAIIEKRRNEADSFYESIHPKGASDEEKKIQRQAIAGVLWSKQFYYFDVHLWLQGDQLHTRPSASRLRIRNYHWQHLNSMRLLCMPDKWEYPWFAAWDLAFHCLTLALVDVHQAKEQLWFLLFEQFQHPNGQIPAYEWEFSDLNPPVQAWAILSILEMEQQQTGKKDLKYLKRCFHKLLLNFCWWVNKVDSDGYNVFEGGFLGLDNITVIDRSVRHHHAERLEQSDGTGWMAFFCLGLMRMALELARGDASYEALATKFFQHFVYIASAMKKRDDHPYNLWDEEDGFFYDVLRFPGHGFMKLRVRSLVGIVPLYAIDEITQEELKQFPEFASNLAWFVRNKAQVASSCIFPKDGGYVLSFLSPEQLKRVLHYVWDPEEFRAPFGFRSLSKYHAQNPFYFEDKSVQYEPGESIHRIKGGNSNWRGPIWFPTTYLLIEALKKFSHIFGDEVLLQQQGELVAPEQIAHYFVERMVAIFKKDEAGHRPFLGEHFPYKGDPHWTDYLWFYEHFHPDTGRGLGASHQAGWTALVANLIQEWRQ